MRAATVPPTARWHCVACAKALRLTACVDPFAVCLACDAGHRYFVWPESPLASQASSAASARFEQTEHQSSAAIAKFWLSNPDARSLLNEQLAELLRIFLEQPRVAHELPFSYCPLCAAALAEYEQPDIWVRGLQCHNGHTWAVRGGHIGGGASGSAIVLHSEPPDSTVAQLLRAWLKGNPYLDPQLHQSVRTVLASSPLLKESVA